MCQDATQILIILDEMRENLDTPFHYFDMVADDLKDILTENISIPPSILLKEYSEHMWEYSEKANTTYSKNLFEMYATITDMLLEAYIGDIFTWEDWI